ncbi:hypothetical protein SAMN05216456_2120 [Devosia crocina]|uniref:DUF4398 domain-containing protein n=1 Tax=Devosia crocina TaxID=429728 RepID=A0A1I7NKV9_9HYPH|nr:hypothetical protein [Devosia crocina]SFV35317.1 hypothetical protein SAMN05216456_2120 [Devosia crocina]
MTRFLLPLFAVSALSLAACDSPPENAAQGTAVEQNRGASVNVESGADGSRTIELTLPESMAPAVDALSNPGATYDALRQRAGEMSEQAKQDAVVNARRAAEAGARALGQTEAEIAQAGDVAERSARDALGL